MRTHTASSAGIAAVHNPKRHVAVAPSGRHYLLRRRNVRMRTRIRTLSYIFVLRRARIYMSCSEHGSICTRQCPRMSPQLFIAWDGERLQ